MRRNRTIAVIAATAIAALAGLVGPAGLADAAEKDIQKIPSCQYCGMDRERFRTTRMLVEYANGSTIGTCSLHCAAVDLAQSFGKEIKAIWAADYRSGRLLDAEQATWVLGSGVPGVMAAKSRVCFADRAAAAAFRKEQGGELADFDAAITSAYCDMWTDTQGIRARRAKSGH